MSQSQSANPQGRRARKYLLAAALLVMAGIVVFYSNRSGQSSGANILRSETVSVDGSLRKFRLVVPKSLSPSSVPVVIAFHGVGDTPESMAAYSHLDQLAIDEQFILVYPEARNTMWATTETDTAKLESNPDLRFCNQLLIQLEERFAIDSKRVYLVGMSNGATFAQFAAFTRSDIAAVVAHSGAKPRELENASRLFPILLLVGENDPVRNTMRTDAEQYREHGHEVELITVPNLGHEWSAGHNGALWEFLSQQGRK